MVSGSYGNQALILQAWGRLEEALALLQETRSDLPGARQQRRFQSSYGNQALILKAWGRLEEAMALHKKAEAIAVELADKETLSSNLREPGADPESWGRLEEALALHKKKEVICLELGNKDGLQASYGNQALILQAWGRLEEALALHKKQEAICLELGNKNSLGYCYWQWAAGAAQKKPDRQKQKLEQALALSPNSTCRASAMRCRRNSTKPIPSSAPRPPAATPCSVILLGCPMSPILTSILLGLTAAAANIFGGAVIVQKTWDRSYLRYFVALGAGFMLATAFVEMVPQSLAMRRNGALLVLGGYLLVHLFEHTITPHFHYGEETHADEFVHSHKRASVLLGLMIHTFFDGIAITSGFLISSWLGWIIFLAIFLHKIPEGFTVTSVMLASGLSKRKSWLASVLLGIRRWRACSPWPLASTLFAMACR